MARAGPDDDPPHWAAAPGACLAGPLVHLQPLLHRAVAVGRGVVVDRAPAPLDGLGEDPAQLDEEVALIGGPERLLSLGVSAARLVDRGLAYVLLLPEFGEERIVAEVEWRPAYLLAFVYESREWLVDLGRTAELSADAELPDPLGLIR